MYYIEEMFCHIATHSYFSLLRGVNSPADLIAAASRHEMPALGLVDRNMLSGAVEFWLAGRKAGVRPLLGIDLDVIQPDQRRQLLLLACGDYGWSNLCKLASAVMLQENEGGPITEHCLSEHSRDLIAICLDPGEDGIWLRRLKEWFADRLYAAISLSIPADVSKGRYIEQLARTNNVPTVAVHPQYYLNPGQSSLQRSLASIRENTFISSISPEKLAPPAAYFCDEKEMKQLFQGFPGALERTIEVAERCLIDLPVGLPHYPNLSLPDGMGIQQFLRKLAEDGALKVYGRITPGVRERLEHELNIIGVRGYEPIFLIVKDLLDFARRNDIPTASRGSASSSLVAHCLGITTPDPLEHDLFFERFLNPARVTPPDIDTDICSRGRDQVIQYAFDRFGAERVAMVATINRFRPKSALSDLAKAQGFQPEFIRQLSKELPHAFWSRKEAEDETYDKKSLFTQAINAYPKLINLFKEAETLLEIPRFLSMHPGGLVVSPGSMTERIPVMYSGSKGIVITQMDLVSVESLGLVKIDLLGIRGLTVMRDVASAIQSWRRKEFPGALDVLEAIPQQDDATAKNVEQGNTIGCFQIESPGMRSVLREIHARSVNDILAALALYRPGPLNGGLKDTFVKRFKGLEPVVHLHPALEPLLVETYGVILYQEQVLRIANRLAGFSLSDADLLRRAMSHFDPGKQMDELRAKFILGAQDRAGIPADICETVWDMMAAFAGYGFPKAHAASYAVVGWRSAWCKTHFPAEFMAAVLANWGGYYSQRIYLSEVRRLGLKVKPPNINHAGRQFSVSYPSGDPVLYMGMDQVRELTSRTQERIIRGRPFHSLDDFLTRVDPRQVEADHLTRSGALSDFGGIPSILAGIQSGGWRARQPGLFNRSETDIQDEDWTLEERCRAQEEFLGISVDAHPLELAAEEIEKTGAVTTIDAAEMVGRRICVAGLRMSSHRSRTSQGGSMLFLTLEDLVGMLDVVFFPDIYRRYRNVLSTNQPLVIYGVVQIDNQKGEPVLKADRVIRI